MARLTAEGIDKIVVLSHSGYVAEQRIAAQVAGIDVIIGGHSHTYLSNVSDRAAGPYPTWVEAPDGNRVAIVQAYAFGKYLGELHVTWDDNGIVIAATGEPATMDGQVAEDATLKARVAALAEPLSGPRVIEIRIDREHNARVRNETIMAAIAAVESALEVAA